jgi:hypothetical protein
MKKIIVIAIVFVTLSAAVVADIYGSLDISKDQAKQRLLESIAEGSVVSGNQSSLVLRAKSLPVEMRVAGIHQLIRLAKEYTSGDEFEKDYQMWRKNRLNPGQKTRIGLPKFRKILDNAVDNAIDSKDNDGRYPSDPQKLVKKRLEEFLEVSGSVNFDARLSGNGFADAEYQNKSDQWKMCFRAGREVVNAAREDAKAWLGELQ